MKLFALLLDSCHSIRVVNCCFSQSRIIRFFFCECWCLSRVSFNFAVTCHFNGCFDRRCERDGSSMEFLLYADDLALCEDSLDEIKGEYERWKRESI